MEKNWTKKKKLSNNKHNIVQLDKNFDSATAKAAEKKIQDLVILNSWRQQREKNKQLEADVKNITTHAEGLQLQIYALRQLLDAEKTRVVHVNNDLRKILNALEECNREKHSLIKEKDQLEVRVNITEEKLLGVENECKNLKNELITAKNEARTWEKQLEKEREKINKMKDERKFFIDEDIQETGEESKSANSSNNRKTSQNSRIKSTSCKSGKKNSGRAREDRGVGKVDFGKNVGCIKKLLKESLSLFDEPD